MAKRPPKGKATPPAPRPPLVVSRAKQFKRDVERMKKQGRDMDRLKAAIGLLCSRMPLPSEFRDHALKGEWKSYRDCHIAPDWLLIYKTTATELFLARTGSHAELFGK